jgi:hypothetical protein
MLRKSRWKVLLLVLVVSLLVPDGEAAAAVHKYTAGKAKSKCKAFNLRHQLH